MRKRFLSILLSLCMVLTMLPSVVFATDDPTAPNIGALTIDKTFTAGNNIALEDIEGYKPTIAENGVTITAQGWQIPIPSSDSWTNWTTGVLPLDTEGTFKLRYYVTYSGVTITSNEVTLNVVGKVTTLTLATSPESPQSTGTAITLTATITGFFAGPGVNGQTITFKKDGTTLGTSTLNADGVATYTWTPDSAGTYSLTAEYAATAYNAAAVSSAVNYVASVADYGIWVGTTKVTSSNASNVLNDSGTVTYDAATNTLTLNGANITSATQPGTDVGQSGHSYETGGIFKNDGDLNIVLKGKNTISIDSIEKTSSYYFFGIHTGGKVSIKGTKDDSLLVNLEKLNVQYHQEGIYAHKGVAIEGCTVTATVDTNYGVSGSSGIAVVEGGLSIKDAYVTANGGNSPTANYGIVLGYGHLSIDNSIVVANGSNGAGVKSWGIMTNEKVTIAISGSTITATGNSKGIVFYNKEIDTTGLAVLASSNIDGSGAKSIAFDSHKYVYSPYDNYPYRYVKITPANESKYSVSGTIKNAADSAISGATVTLTNTTDDTKTYTGITDSNGNYSITGVPDGSYAVVVTKSSETFDSGNARITVSGSNISGGSGNISVTTPPIVTSYNIWVGGTRVTSINKEGITGPGITGTVSYDSSTETLTLQGAAITGFYKDEYNNSGGIYATNDLSIVLIGSNTINITFPAGGAGVFSLYEGITMSGTGNLTISLGEFNQYSMGIRALKNITINECTVTAAGGQTTTDIDASSIGINSQNGSLSITKATVIANGGEVPGGAYSGGIFIRGPLTVTNSTVTATGYSQALWVDDLISALDSIVTASTDRTGSGATTTTANKAASNNYKYVNIAAASQSDTTAPTLTAGAVNRTSETTATVKFNSTEGGTYYYKIGGAVTNTSTGGTALSAGETTINLNGLTSGAKDIYIVAKDAAGNTSLTTFKITIPAYTFQVSGIVKDHNSNVISGATVKLMAGPTQIGDTVTTDANGAFTIPNVPNGTYNLVVSKNDIIVTSIITVNNSNYAAGTITLPSGKTNSVVEVKGSETPKIVVGNLDKQFANIVQFDNKGVTASDMAVVTSGGAILIKFVAEKKDNTAANADDIISTAGTNNKTVGIFIDLSILKTVTSGSAITTTLIGLNELIDVLIPLDETLQNKTDYIVYRYHEGFIESITTTANEDGEKFELIDNNTTIKLTVKKFSTYAIAYTSDTELTPNRTNSRPSLPTINVEQTKGGEIVISIDKKTATITPDDGYVIVDVTVDGKSVGPVEQYTFEDSKNHNITGVFVKETALPYYLQNDEKIYIGFSVIAGRSYKYIAPEGVTVEFRENPKVFKDNTIEWAKPYIDFVTERELFLGTSQDIFSPNTSMTRAMFVTVLGRLYERSYGIISGTSTFNDIDVNAYYAKYVEWANENGVIKGIGNNKFAPDENVTREQMAVIMLNFAKLLNKSDVTENPLVYTDSASISSWAIGGAIYCQETNIIKGRDGGNFAPQESSTRAEVAAVIERLIKTIMK